MQQFHLHFSVTTLVFFFRGVLGFEHWLVTFNLKLKSRKLLSLRMRPGRIGFFRTGKNAAEDLGISNFTKMT